MGTRKSKKISADADALRMLGSLTGDDAALQELLAEERANAAVARQIYERRTAKGLTQRQLAELIGTQQPVMSSDTQSYAVEEHPTLRTGGRS